MRVLVLGGRGFIGRNVVQALQEQGVDVEIGSRYQLQSNKLQNLNTHQIKMQEITEPTEWAAYLKNIDVVVNCVGILRERFGESYAQIHTKAPQLLAEACKINQVRFIHISALGLSANAKSDFIRSKYNGEQAILKANKNAKIVRVSLLDGIGGFGAKWIRLVANWPVYPILQEIVTENRGLIAPLQVTDLGEAIANICRLPNAELPAIIELGGSEVMNMAQLLTALRSVKNNQPAYVIHVPKLLVRLASHICDFFHFSPLSFGHFELMQGYNVPANNSLEILLKRMPKVVGIKCRLAKQNLNKQKLNQAIAFKNS